MINKKRLIVVLLTIIVGLFFPLFLSINSSPIILQAKFREITVNGKKSLQYEIRQEGGGPGLTLKKGEPFNVIIENHLDVPTGIHWHGLILPNSQDGVPFVTQPPIPPQGKYPYNFLITQAGTFWMHSHYGLEEQKLLAAPLILLEPYSTDEENVLMFLSDFTFKDPQEIFDELKRGGLKNAKFEEGMKPDLNDVQYDAFLANWKTLSDPDQILIEPGKEIRLRLINGSSSSNFFIDLGELVGEAIAVDGSEIEPYSASQFELPLANRLDLRIKIPKNGEPKAYPILAQGEGLKLRTGIILSTKGSKIPEIQEKADLAEWAMSYTNEKTLKAQKSLSPKKIDRKLLVTLDGDMKRYIWMLNGKVWREHTPLIVKEGERVEIEFLNKTMMSHPMHLHGHVFQITEIEGVPLKGAMRDTILVLPKSSVKIQFDATNPGIWPLHCHNLYHLEAGMMTTLNYEGFKEPNFKKK